MRSRHARLAGTVLLALALASGLLGLDVGAAAPDFHAPTVEGRSFSLREAAQEHKAVAVLFLSTVCPYAKYFESEYRMMSADFGRKGVLFVGVYSNVTEPFDEVAAHAKEHGFLFPVLKDTGSRFADLLGAERTPEVFLFDHEGRLRYRGRVASKYHSPDLRKALESLVNGTPVKLTEAKAFGCAIVRP